MRWTLPSGLCRSTFIPTTTLSLSHPLSEILVFTAITQHWSWARGREGWQLLRPSLLHRPISRLRPKLILPFKMVFYHDCTCWTDGCTLPHNLEIHSEYLNHIIPRRMKSEYRTHAHTISRRDRQAAEKHAPYTDIFATIPLCLSSLPPSCSSSRR